MKMLTNSAAPAKKCAKRKQKPTIEFESERACFQSDPQKTNVHSRHFFPENISCHSVAFERSLFSNEQQIQSSLLKEWRIVRFLSKTANPHKRNFQPLWNVAWRDDIRQYGNYPCWNANWQASSFFRNRFFSKRVLITQAGTSAFFMLKRRRVEQQSRFLLFERKQVIFSNEGKLALEGEKSSISDKRMIDPVN